MSKNLTKAELVAQIAEDTSLPISDAGKIFNSIVNRISDSLSSGDNVQLVGFGSFKTVEKAARPGRNPNNGEKILIPARTSVKFTAGKKLSVAVEANNKPRKKGFLSIFRK